MADNSDIDLKAEVKAALEGADLQTVTPKILRKQLEEKLGIDLSSRRKEIDALIMSEIENQVTSEEEEVSEDEQPTKKGKKVDDDEYNPKASKKAAPKKKAAGRKRKAEDSDNADDEDWGKKKKKSGGGGKKNSAFTKAYKLSPELAELMGQDVMQRHQVVKKVWEIIKDRNLQDPSQKQFAICDDDLFKVMGVKRFKTFGMMKHLKTHFIETA